MFFKKNLYLVYETVECFVYNLKNEEWLRLADTKEDRYCSACTVLKNKVLVSGGRYVRNSLNS